MIGYVELDTSWDDIAENNYRLVHRNSLRWYVVMTANSRITQPPTIYRQPSMKKEMIGYRNL